MTPQAVKLLEVLSGFKHQAATDGQLAHVLGWSRELVASVAEELTVFSPICDAGPHLGASVVKDVVPNRWRYEEASVDEELEQAINRLVAIVAEASATTSRPVVSSRTMTSQARQTLPAPLVDRAKAEAVRRGELIREGHARATVYRLPPPEAEAPAPDEPKPEEREDALGRWAVCRPSGDHWRPLPLLTREEAAQQAVQDAMSTGKPVELWQRVGVVTLRAAWEADDADDG